MTYPENFEQKIGFDRIRCLISEQCLSPLGKERVEAIRFSAKKAVVIERLEQTCELMRILEGDREFPSDHFIDVRPSLHRIRPAGTFLDERELFDLKRALQTIDRIVRFFHAPGNGETPYPFLTALAGNVPVFPQLIQKIDAVLDKYGNVKDQASDGLMQIRKEMAAATGSVSRILQQILRAAQAEGWVENDVTPALRDGRLVIPVTPTFKRKLRGIVHDESASGKTVYIEPEPVVEANNRIRELEGKERREIVRILTEVTDRIRPATEEILHSFSFLAEIDLIRAKALFTVRIHGIKPALGDDALLEWAGAVHPLLSLSHRQQNKPVEPLDVALNPQHRILIISGPNAGGKSVCLKTVGLLQYMLQCGLPIPLHESSRTGLFERIFIDIGDEQSIENDLSTYSSHLTGMKFFVKNSNDHTLLLIDEFGSGTEPLIGGAIAEALLERFNRNGCFGVITTHYRNLKHYAEKTEGVVNGAMLYDRQRMQPLFKLSIGHPGSSFAVEIARKIGLPEEVIAEASEKAGAGSIETDKYLQDIVRDKQYWEKKRQQIRQQEKRLEELTGRYEAELKELARQRREIVRAAQTQAEQMLAEANAKIEHTIREIKEAQADRERTREARQALERFKETVRAADPGDDPALRKINKQPEGRKQTPPPPTVDRDGRTEWAAGDPVRLKGQQTVGRIIERSGKQVTVSFGMIKSTLKTEQLERVSPEEAREERQRTAFISPQTVDRMYEKALHFRQEIDVRGMRGDEALQAVVYFIDDAMQIGVERVRILHGTGNGILRQLIRDYLRSVSGVSRYGDEHVQFGGAGITVVEFDNRV